MDRIASKKNLFLAALIASLAGSLCAGAYSQQAGQQTAPPAATAAPSNKPKPKSKTLAKAHPAQKKADDAASVEPDKVLYQHATDAMKHAKYTEARLDFQTLINTYPDSEYLAKAKLGTADSFYKEGGTSNLTQAVEEYKNFIVFFPFLDEASYAQMQVAMAHYKMMEKADRDTSQAEAAEDEFRDFILKYPQSPLLPQAQQNLRNVQEVLADGEFRIAHFYYAKPDYRAAWARLTDVTGRYPLYSQSDQALWMLGEIDSRMKQAQKNEDEKNRWADLAGQCYRRIVQDYPLSPLADPAKERLKSMGMDVPAPRPDAVARMKQQEAYEKAHHQTAALKVPMEMIKSNPDMFAASRTGDPNLNPPDDTISPTDFLNPSPGGNSFNIAATSVSTGGGGDAKSSVDTESVPTSDTTVAAPPDAAAAGTSAAAADATAPVTAPAVEMIDAPGNATIENSAPAQPSPGLGPAPPPPPTGTAPAGPTAFSDSAPTGGMPGSTSSGTQTSSAPAATGQTNTAADPKTESTSKKKKGLQKLVPW